MRLKQIQLEDFVNYKFPSLFLGSCFCSWKCCIELGLDTSVCQNSPLAKSEIKEVSNSDIYSYYTNNPITQAVVIGGLEPMAQANEVISLIDYFRKNGEDCPFVIYTGYYPNEIQKEIEPLKQYKNIIIKFGRYVPNQHTKFDEILGVYLASDNQYAQKIS